jgi:CBS domain-containing protein
MKTVRDVMTRPVLSVRPETPLKEVASILVEHRISGLPVVDATGRVLGVVSEGDLLMKGHDPDAVHHRPLARIFGESEETRQLLAKAEARTAGDAMTAPAITIDASKPVNVAATMMVERKVNRLPVTEDDRLVGIVTRADVVKTFVRTDDELVSAIRSEVLLHALWIDPEHFAVSAVDGVVTVQGRVERRSTAAMIAPMIEMVPGVVAVNADVAWSVDDRGIEAPAPDYFSPKSPS